MTEICIDELVTEPGWFRSMPVPLIGQAEQYAQQLRKNGHEIQQPFLTESGWIVMWRVVPQVSEQIEISMAVYYCGRCNLRWAIQEDVAEECTICCPSCERPDDVEADETGVLTLATKQSTPPTHVPAVVVLTKKQGQVFEIIKLYIDAKGYAPTVREIAAEMGLKSVSSVHAHLLNLEKAGLIKRDREKPRALKLIG